MQFRIFAPFVAVILAGSALVSAAPAPDIVVARADLDIVNSGIYRRALPTLQDIIGNLSATLDPILTDLNNQISTTGAIDVGAVTNDLNTISTALNTLETQLEGFVANPASLGPTSITALTAVIVPFITNLLTTLNSVQSVANATPAIGVVVSPIVSTILNTLVSDGTLLTQLAPGILSTLISTITGLLPQLGSLNLGSLL